jgi:hypothetical protein
MSQELNFNGTLFIMGLTAEVPASDSCYAYIGGTCEAEPRAFLLLFRNVYPQRR